MAAPVDDNTAADEQDVILTIHYVNGVVVCQGDDGFGDGGNRPTRTGNGVFIVKKTSLGFQIIWAGNIDGEATAKERKDVLMHRGGVPIALDVVGCAECQEAAADGGDNVAIHVFDIQGIANGKNLAIDKQDITPGMVLDGEIVANIKDLLANDVSGHIQ